MSVAVDRRDGAEVDELHLIAADHDVVGFDVVVDQPDRMQIPDSGKHLEHVRDGLFDGQQVVGAGSVALITLAGDLLECSAADVLHHDVAEPLAEVGDVLDEVVDLNDAGMVHRGEELSLGQSDLLCFGVRRVEQTLEDDGSVGDVAVDREVDPAESTVGDGAGDLVLARDERALRESRNERIARTTVGTLPGQCACTGSRRAADGASAAPAVALALGDDRRIEHRVLRLDVGDLGQFDEPRAESTVVHSRPTTRHESARLPDRDQRFVGIECTCRSDRTRRLVAHPDARSRLRRSEIRPLRADVEGRQIGTLGPDVEVGEIGTLGSDVEIGTVGAAVGRVGGGVTLDFRGRRCAVLVTSWHLASPQSRYVGWGGPYPGPRMDSHLSYISCHRPDARISAMVPLTKRTMSSCPTGMPTP